MSDLFATAPVPPLAEALRPKVLDEVIGQSHLLGDGKPLRLAFQSGQALDDAALTYERLGSPEGELALGQAVIYLAIAAKSNAGYTVYNAARALVNLLSAQSPAFRRGVKPTCCDVVRSGIMVIIFARQSVRV